MNIKEVKEMFSKENSAAAENSLMQTASERTVY